MDKTVLEIFLPAFMIVFIAVTFAWRYFRQLDIAILKPGRPGTQIDHVFLLLILLAAALAITYAYFPRYYILTGPIDWLDIPVINILGVLVLKSSLIWIVVAQFNIERKFTQMKEKVKSEEFRNTLAYSKGLCLLGIVIMLIGLFITISSVMAILICIIGAIAFGQHQKTINRNGS